MSVTTQIFPASLPRRWPPRDTVIIDNGGLPVDVSGSVWRLHDPMRPVSLNWNGFPLDDCIALDGLRSYVANLIKSSLSIGAGTGTGIGT